MEVQEPLPNPVSHQMKYVPLFTHPHKSPHCPHLETKEQAKSEETAKSTQSPRAIKEMWKTGLKSAHL